MSKTHAKRIGARLVTNGQAILDAKAAFVEFTDDRAANELINDLKGHPHAYVIACILDRQMKAERVWKIPYLLGQRLGTFEFDDLRRLRESTIHRAMTKPESLHRFHKGMSHNLKLALDRIHRDYGGDAGKIWADRPSSATVIFRFLQFRGVGQKIATMAANILARDFKVPMSDHYSIDVSVDVQVRRVMTRLGLTEKGASAEQIIYRARSVNPEFPGIIDHALWEIGRTWCRPKRPECGGCDMRRLCPSAQSAASPRGT
ncbi:MAG: iron-sulfur cluster loop [Phycisphaerae bacterium]|jgi:endonuclease III|nr:iron-sulfur cluster loop [Phycisphaerae bacterium]